MALLESVTCECARKRYCRTLWPHLTLRWHGSYRKRAEKKPDIGAPQALPKRVRFVFDISGSM